MNELNKKVTMAIMAAEEATYQAIVAWDAVKQAEQALVDHPNISELEKSIANRGVAYASKNVDVMCVLIGRRAGKWAVVRDQ
jgi:hypothetical protein